MGLLETIINFFKKLFGGGAAPAPALATGRVGPTDDDDDDDDDDDMSPEQYAREQEREAQAFMARFEADGHSLNGVDVSDPVTFWTKAFAVEQGQMDGQSKDAAARAQGFANGEHFDLVQQYISCKWSHVATNDEGEVDWLIKDEFTNSMMQARMGQQQAAMAAQADANPELFEPIAGVTLETYAAAAAACAGLGEGATGEQVDAAIAGAGLDRATYDAASAGWQARMSTDMTYVLVTKYGAAFAAAQGQGAGAAEPVGFEKYCEVMAAQEVWSEQGLDVNAGLRDVFGINAAEYSKWGSYWSPKMATDIAMMREYTRLSDHYKAHYRQSGGGGQDDDLDI